MVTFRVWHFPFAKSKYKAGQNCWKQPFRGTGNWPKAVKKNDLAKLLGLWVRAVWVCGLPSGLFPAAPTPSPTPLLGWLELKLYQLGSGRENQQLCCQRVGEWLDSGKGVRGDTKTCGFAGEVIDLVGNRWEKPATMLTQGCGSSLG